MLKPNSAVTTNLIRARELIADEKNWCQGQWHIGERSCAAGALYRAAGFTRSGAFIGEMSVAEKAHFVLAEAAKPFGMSLAEVNDKLGHTAVMRMYSRAIELSLQDAS